ncbi:MAG TPA: hypothetical protein VF898_06120 [Chloroflexota bacterium]
MTLLRRHRSVLGLVLGIACIILPSQVLAAPSPHIAPNLYPARTRITTLTPLSNQQMDCDWGFACHDGTPVTDAPVFHLRTQDDLQRVSGWAQFGDVGHGSTRILFAVFASRYSGTDSAGLPWNTLAFADFRGALMIQGYDDLLHVPRLVPRGVVGNAGAQLVRSPNGDVYALSCWTGSIEVEGLTVYAPGSAARQRQAVRDLTRQMRAAVTAVEGER